MASNSGQKKLTGVLATIRAFGQDTRGAVVMLAAAAVPLLLLVAGGAVNFASALKQRQSLQAAADAAAIAGAKSLSLSDAERDNVTEIVKGRRRQLR
nr:pilus assembly protein TadG-related protein [uncultured Brevundimonas sp.]